MFGRVLSLIVLNYYYIELSLYNFVTYRIKFIRFNLSRSDISNFRKSFAKSRYPIFINKLKIYDRDF